MGSLSEAPFRKGGREDAPRACEVKRMKLFKSICCIFLAAWLPSILLAAPEEVKMFPTDLIEGIPSIPETFTRIPGAGPDGSCVLRKVRSEIGEYNCLQLPLEGLTAGKMYRLSLWVRQSDISKENTGIFNLEFYDRGTFSQYQTIAIDKGSRDWREVVLEFALYDTPYDRAMMVFYLDRSATGTYEVAMPQLTEMELTLPEQRVQEFSDLNAAGLPEAARKTLEGIRDRYIEKMIRIITAECAFGPCDTVSFQSHVPRL